MKHTAKLNKQIKVAKKYKIDRTYVPYMRVEYLTGDTHEVVEFDGDVIRGTSWQSKPEDKPKHSWSYFIAGAAWVSVIWAIVVLL